MAVVHPRSALAARAPAAVQRVALCVYGSLRQGQTVHEALFGHGDLVGVMPALVPGYRLWVVTPSGGRYAGYAMALPAEAHETDRPMVADLLVPDPSRYDSVLTTLREYETEGLSPVGEDPPYVEQQIEVRVVLPQMPGEPEPCQVRLPARIWLPGRSMLMLAAAGHVTPAPGNDWITWSTPAGPNALGQPLPRASYVPMATTGVFEQHRTATE